MKLARVIIAGGGTGGHIYPGVALAEEILRRNPAATVTFVGTSRGLEGAILPPLGHPLVLVDASRLMGGSLWQKLAGLLRLPRAIWQSWRIIARLKPEVVIGVGGYASGPALLAAWLRRERTAIQEQNAAPGLTNRWLGRLVRRVFVGFEGAFGRFPAAKTMFTGNPLRHALTERLAPALAPTPPPGDRLRVLVFGGSQGARFLNERAPATFAALRAAAPGLGLVITHQTGQADLDATRARYAELGLPATVTAFIHDMPTAYASADLALCRAGALTLAELTAVGLPALLVPFPHAADNHQEANARDLATAGAALVVTQRDWADAAVTDTLARLVADPARLAAMRYAARSLGRLDAAARITDALEELAA
jgi:UDP-N-acetylglucosamine--N-acetylmuramyl-(pentapeptide) pyrophosphoryl-undecaprenol N-acetylglucosamine transferase